MRGGDLGANQPKRLPPPSAEFQLGFLRNLQRLLEEGAFTATYKFALLHALADLAVRFGDDSGDDLLIPVRAIEERYVELYWHQVVPWPGGPSPRILAQIHAERAAIVSRVEEARKQWGGRIDRVRADESAWSDLVREVGRTVRKDPLQRLHIIGPDHLPFLFDPKEIRGKGGTALLRLRPGIGYCLRSFHSLVLELVQGGWIRFIRRRNPDVLQEQKELGDFLFGSPRGPLNQLRLPLLDLQNGDCFYCRKAVWRRDAHVDHFVPWSRYPVDLGHNFVVSHGACNLAKSDHLADIPHLERWTERNLVLADELTSLSTRAGIPVDHVTSLRVTEWAYQQVAARSGLVWSAGRSLSPLAERWREILPVS